MKAILTLDDLASSARNALHLMRENLWLAIG